MAEVVLLPDDYRDIVTKTFVDRAIRSALLIDDQFPRFDEVIEDQEKIQEKYKESDRARRLYKIFRERRILCDVENQVANLEENDLIERVRKSDFILLDYHLTADETEISHSIDLLRKLSRSNHFNIVVLYTKHPDLREVWLNIAVNLKGGWKTPTEILGDNLIDQWDELEAEGALPIVDKEILIKYLSDKDVKILRDPLVVPLREEYIEKVVEQKHAGKFIIASINKLANDNLVANPQLADSGYSLVGSCENDGPYWIQSGNTFIAIIQKPTEADPPEEPEIIFDRLSEALVAWRPNIVQILLSEIQNILELDGLAADEDYTGTPERQTGIGYHLLSLMPTQYEAAETTVLSSAIISTVEKIAESIRNRVAIDAGMLEIARKLIEPMVTSQEWSNLPANRKDRVAPLSSFTKSVLRQSQKLNNEDVFIDLNTFLSTERFGGINVTTGSVFSDSTQSAWWLCCSAACDMAPRPPSNDQKWLASISPAKSVIALQLERINSGASALENAEHGSSVFINDADGEYRYFKATLSNGHPVWEMMLVSDYGKVSETDGKYKFIGQRILMLEEGGENRVALVEPAEFIVAAQLRPEYAARLLQMTGQHLSRIGVDYVNLPPQS